jgi:hypothetical protein
MRAQQRLLVIASMRILPQLVRPAWEPTHAISFVPEFGRIAVGALANFDLSKFRRETRATLRASGINRFLLGLDVSLNHDNGKRDEAHWQLHGGASSRSRADRGVSGSRHSQTRLAL